MKTKNSLALVSALLGLLALCKSCASTPSSQHPAFAAQQASCASCHDGRAQAQGPDLRGMPADYLLRQLHHFRQGQRGADMMDFQGRLMAQMLALQPAELDTLLADDFAAQTPRQAPQSSAPMDESATRGAQLYAARCQGCHDSSLGRFFTGSPQISTLAASYVEAQLNAFAHHWRKTDGADKHVKKMQALSEQLTPQEKNDIIRWWQLAR